MSKVQLNYTLQRDEFCLDVDVKIPDSGVTGVFGPSGSGKTTLLRCIAGLEATADETPVHKRHIGYVFQQPQLFPHMSVGANIRYGFKRAADKSANVDEIVRMMDVESLLSRQPDSLSGGEAQRVAIARAFCQSPKMVLMDEPLSAVDETRKDRLLPYLDRLKDEVGVPIVYVSHDIDEICKLCDHLVVLDEGKAMANGDLHSVLGRTDLQQLGGANTGVVLDVDVEDFDPGFNLTALRCGKERFYVPGKVEAESVRVRIAANDVSLVRERPVATSILNVVSAVVAEVQPEDDATVLVSLEVGNATLLSRVTKKSAHLLGIKPGDRLYAQVKSVTIRR